MIFSLSKPTAVSVTVDYFLLLTCKPAKNRPSSAPLSAYLFVCTWNPTDIFPGLHQIEAKVVCEDGSITAHSHPFSVDGLRAANSLQASFFLLGDVQQVVRSIFLIFYCFTLLLLLSPFFIELFIPRFMFFGIPFLVISSVQAISSRPGIHRLLILYVILMLISPWFVGELVEGQIGFFSVHGVVTGGRLFPTPFGFVAGIFQLVLAVWPLMIFLGLRLSVQVRTAMSLSVANGTRALPFSLIRFPGLCPMALCVYIYFLVSVLWSVQSCWEVYATYGLMAFLLSPIKLGFLALTLLVSILSRK